MTKFCKACNRELNITEFSMNRSAKDGLQFYCKPCSRQMTANNHQRRLEQEPTYLHRRTIKRKYGIDPETYDRLLMEQGNRCAICNQPETATAFGKPIRLAVDHNHQTGQVRGLLCDSCNFSIAGIEHADLDRYLAYLEERDATFYRA